MSAVERIEEEFKRLAPNEQAEALERFAKAVYGEEEENPELLERLARRLAQIESGVVTGKDAFEVLSEMRAKHSR